MKYLKVKLKIYYGHKSSVVPSTTLAGALTQFYSIQGSKKDVNFGFSDFKLIDKSVFYQNRVNLGRVYYYSFPYLHTLYLSRGKVYGEYEGCIVGNLEEAKEEIGNLILINFSEVETIDDVRDSNSDISYALSIPVTKLDVVKAFGNITRIRFLRFHGLNDIIQHPIYVFEGNGIKKSSGKEIIKLVDIKLKGKNGDYNILLDFLNEIDELDKIYMKMAHGIVVPKECYDISEQP
ncbi:hypothetical protein [Sulfurisphaera ohwakuensis]|uniref:hypothetical protein n=1 Tax=Sulfurisphaera ohwakuensis TaxID=69656 RepID=UPI0036F278E4